MKKIYSLIAVALLALISPEIFAQPWNYDFGTGTGTYTTASGANTTFFTGTPAGGGTYRLRCASSGNVGTGFVLANPGTTLGTASELQINASVTGSSQKFTVYGWTSPSNTAYAKFNFRNTSTGNGALAFHLGNGALLPYQDATGYTSYNASLAVLLINYTGGAITTVQRRASGAFTTIASSGITKDANNLIEVYGNNNSTSTTYSRSGTNTLNAQSWDLWVDGTKISPSGGWPVAGTLASNTTLGGFGFFGESATANAAFMYIDDLEYSNAVPAPPACTAPSTQASNIAFSGITTSQMDVNWTNGNGAGRVVVMNSTNSFTPPANGANPAASTAWANLGQQVVFNGTGSGPITITGLSATTTYHFRVYEYCSPDRTYQTSTASLNPNSQITATPATPTLTAGTLTAFGSLCVGGGPYGPNSFTISGTTLTTANVTVSSFDPAYTFSTTAGGSYTASLSLTQPGGTYSQAIFVKFTPIAAIAYSGNITLGGGGGATSVTVAASGTGLPIGLGTVTTPTFTSVTSTTATLGGNITNTGCSTVTERGIYWSLTNGFADGAGTQVSTTGSFSTGIYTQAVTGLPSNTTIYFKAYAVNGTGAFYSTQSSFTTSQQFLNVGDISILGWNSNTPDNFTFVTWVDLPNNMLIKFTDGGFNGTAPNSANTAGNARGSENFVIWKNNTGNTIVAGTVIKIQSQTATIGLAVGGTTSGGGGLENLSSGGDQLIAYQGSATSGATPDYSGTGAAVNFTGNILYGLNFQGSGTATSWITSLAASGSTSYLPTELNVANGNIAIANNASSAQYTGLRLGQATFAGYKALVNNPANWTKKTGTVLLTTLNTTAFLLSTGGPAQIIVTDVNGAINPTQNAPFTLTIETRDALDIPQSVTSNTDFQITLSSGTGVLGGTLTGTILAGSSSFTFTGITYNVAEGNVILDVSVTAGPPLATGSSSLITVEEPASLLAIPTFAAFAFTNNNIGNFTVEARRTNATVDPTYTGSATVALFSGTGAVLGTTVKPFVNGIASFNDINFNTSGVKQIEVTATGLASVVSSAVTISTATLSEVILPKHMQGTTVSSNSTRMPFAYRVALSGLEPSKTYRYINQMVEAADPGTISGAGNTIYANPAGFVRTTSSGLSTLGEYGEFTTDISGSYTGWFITEPTGNARFTAGNDVYCRITLNNGNGGTSPAVRLTTSNTVKVTEFGTSATQGTGLRGNSTATAKNFILVYDNVGGTGRPISSTYVESDGVANTTANNYVAFYNTSVNATAGAYGLIIPNTLPNGIRRIEQRSLTTGNIVSCPATDANGTWPGGAVTVNPNTGTTAKVITAIDAPFDPLCVALIPGNNDNFLSAVLAPASGSAYPAQNCFSGTLVGAGVSIEGSTLNVLPGGGQDRWYAFVATSSAIRAAVTTSSFNAVLELHKVDGTLIDTENSVSVVGGEIMSTNNLVEGTTYFIAVRSYNGAVGTFTVCISSLLDSYCATGSGTYIMCSAFKPSYAGSVSYTYTFTPTGVTPGVPTSVTAPGQILLSNTTLALLYGGTYSVRIDANFSNLVNAVPAPDPIIVIGTQICNITIAAQPLPEVVVAQRCPATLLRGTLAQAKPFVCNAIDYRWEFTEVTACNGLTTVSPAFTRDRGAASPYMALNFSTPMPLVPGSYYKVRVAPILPTGLGVYGPSQVIQISALSAMGELNAIDMEGAAFKMEEEGTTTRAVIYPNPNNGQMMVINVTDIISDKVNVRIMDNTGRMVYSNSFAAENALNQVVTFDRPLAQGLYLVQFVVDGKTITQRLAVTK
jgi:hypothetical protein